jgi:hypothetical protein
MGNGGLEEAFGADTNFCDSDGRTVMQLPPRVQSGDLLARRKEADTPRANCTDDSARAGHVCEIQATRAIIHGRPSRQGEEDGKGNMAPWLVAEQRWRRRERGRQGLPAVLSLAAARDKRGGGFFPMCGSCEGSPLPPKSCAFRKKKPYLNYP